MPYPLIQPAVIAIATAIAAQGDCGGDTTDDDLLQTSSGPQTGSNTNRAAEPTVDTREPMPPALVDSRSKRQLKKRNSVSFRDDSPPVSSSFLLQQQMSNMALTQQLDVSESSASERERIQMQQGAQSSNNLSTMMEDDTYGTSAAATTTRSRSIKSIFGRDKNAKGASANLRRSLADEEELNEEAPEGFVDGDFASGKVLDLNMPQGCFVMAFHPGAASILAVGLLNGEGVALYETKSYSLIVILDQEDSVSSLRWLTVGDGNFDTFSLLAVGCLDGKVSVYRMKPKLLELQGADLVHQFSIGSQVRSMSLGFYGSSEKEILLTVGAKNGVLKFSRYDILTCAPLDEVRTAHVHKSAILCISVSTDGSLIATCGKSGNVSVCRIEKTGSSLSLGSELYSTSRNGSVRSVVFSQDEKLLVFGGYDKTIIMVDTELWATIRSLKLHGTINDIAFDPLDRYISVGCRDKSFTLFDTSTFFPIKTVHTSGWVSCISWGNVEGTNDVVAIRSDKSCVSILDLTPVTMTQYKLPAERSGFSSLSWSFDGRFLARIKGSRVVISDSLKDFADLYEADLNGELKCLSFCSNPVKRDHLAVVGLHGHVHIFRIRHDNSRIVVEPVVAKFIEDDLWTVAWSADAECIVTGGRGKNLHILKADDLKPTCKSLDIDGRVWAVAFMPSFISNQLQLGSAYGMAVGSGDYVATLFDTATFQPTLQVLRPRTVRCLAYNPVIPFIAVGDGGNIISIVNIEQEETSQEIRAAGRVNALAFSPTGNLLVVGTDDCKFILHETETWKVVQEIPVAGFALSAAFSASGKYLALGSAGGDYSLIQLGPFLSINLVPLSSTGGVNDLPDWALHEVLYRSGYGPSLVQRYMLEGNQESLRRAAALVHSHPDSIYCFNRSTNDSSFDIALHLKKPNLLKLILTTFVDGTLEADGRTILTTQLPERGIETLNDMVLNSPPEFVVAILASMTYIKVPFTEAHEVVGARPMEMGSLSYTDPWIATPLRGLDRIKSEKELKSKLDNGYAFRVPAVLPLPDLGSLKFLSSLLYKIPPTAFDNDAMGLVLRVMWVDYIRKYFLFDLIVYLFYFALWVCLVDWTSSTTSRQEDSLSGVEYIMSIAMLFLNTMYAVKEVFQSGFGRRLAYFKSLWNVVDFSSIALVYAYSISTMARGGTGTGIVPLAVITTLLLTMKLLSYLRGFDSTGWLISVLVQNFQDVQGFMVVLVSILFGFTTSFRLLLGNVRGRCELRLDEGEEIEEVCDPDPFASITRSFLSTFELTILGTYDQGVLSDSDHGLLAILTFLVAVVAVLVVALNALIAVLSDSYARVQENAVANRRKERAELIVEYLSILPTKQRRAIEQKTRYFHALLEADEDGDLLINKDDWEGGLNALKKDLEELNEETNEMNRRALEELRAEINEDLGSFRREVVGMLENLSEEMRQIRNIQSQGGVTFNGKNVRKAVKMAKSIGKKGAFPWQKDK